MIVSNVLLKDIASYSVRTPTLGTLKPVMTDGHPREAVLVVLSAAAAQRISKNSPMQQGQGKNLAPLFSLVLAPRLGCCSREDKQD
jgi:hypothetical protein